TLRRAVNYPDAAHSRSMAETAKVLEKVELGHLADHLDQEGPWDQILSGGEKQRLAFARLFLHRPDIIVLDEATAALDSRSQGRLMRLLSREFTDATVISIGHRPELAAFHHRKIFLERSRTGAKLVDEAGSAQPGSAPLLEQCGPIGQYGTRVSWFLSSGSSGAADERGCHMQTRSNESPAPG